MENKERESLCVAGGDYINVWDSDGGFDIYIILAECVGTPDIEDVEKIANAIYDCESKTPVAITEALDALDLEVLGWGFTVMEG